ncbi:hypothetical protein K2P56_04685 [Patescibacteria group bacterium]|nr:hypothetical protein [Patescibacteria group bacterium]
MPRAGIEASGGRTDLPNGQTRVYFYGFRHYTHEEVVDFSAGTLLEIRDYLTDAQQKPQKVAVYSAGGRFQGHRTETGLSQIQSDNFALVNQVIREKLQSK